MSNEAPGTPGTDSQRRADLHSLLDDIDRLLDGGRTAEIAALVQGARALYAAELTALRSSLEHAEGLLNDPDGCFHAYAWLKLAVQRRLGRWPGEIDPTMTVDEVLADRLDEDTATGRLTSAMVKGVLEWEREQALLLAEEEDDDEDGNAPRRRRNTPEPPG
jgi:hypothetical protein